jgi:hypothetical protein
MFIRYHNNVLHHLIYRPLVVQLIVQMLETKSSRHPLSVETIPTTLSMGKVLVVLEMMVVEMSMRKIFQVVLVLLQQVLQVILHQFHNEG